jgi:hypothetical protein
MELPMGILQLFMGQGKGEGVLLNPLNDGMHIIVINGQNTGRGEDQGIQAAKEGGKLTPDLFKARQDKDILEDMGHTAGNGKDNQDSTEPKDIGPENIFPLHPDQTPGIAQGGQGQENHQQGTEEINKIYGKEREAFIHGVPPPPQFSW